MQKSFRFALAASLGVLAACAAFGSQAQDKVPLKIWWGVGEQQEIFLEELKAAFEAANPNVEISYELFPWEQYKQTIQVGLASSNPPDVFFNWSGDWVGRTIAEGQALDITESGDAEGGFKSSVPPEVLASFGRDGRQYGVPMGSVGKYFFYSKPFFAEHALEIPATFGELVGLCKAIREIDPAMVPLPLGNSERWKLNHLLTMMFQRQMGLAAVTPDYDLSASEAAIYTNPGYIAALNKVLELQDAGCFQDAPNATTPEASRAMFSAGVSPMIYCGTWCINGFISDGFSDFAMFRFPAFEDGTKELGENFGVPEGFEGAAGSSHSEEAAKLLSFMVSKEMNARFATLLSEIPANPAANEAFDDASEQFKWVLEDTATFTAPAIVLNVVMDAATSEVMLNNGVELLNRTKTPEQFMQEIRDAALKAKQALAG